MVAPHVVVGADVRRRNHFETAGVQASLNTLRLHPCVHCVFHCSSCCL
jgi:hypothetical protein